jgi:ketosteroid isomerase-like protein
MKTTRTALGAFAAAMLLSGTVMAAPEESADVVAIGKVEHAFNGATQFELVSRLFAPDAVLLDMYAPGFYRGLEEIRAGLEWQYGGVTALNNSLDGIEIMHDGKLACAASIARTIVTLSNSDKTPDVTWLITDVLRKTNGRWDIIVNHAGASIDPKTWDNLAGKVLAAGRPLVVHDADWFAGAAIPVAQAKTELRKWADDVYAAKTAEEEIKFYDPDVSLFTSLAPSLHYGRDQVLKRFREDRKGIKAIRIKERASGIETDGVLGVVWSLQDVDRVLDNGETQKLNVRQLDCLRRKDGKWLAVHEMRSFPIDPHTWKGVPLLQYGDKPVPKAGTGNTLGPIGGAVK